MINAVIRNRSLILRHLLVSTISAITETILFIASFSFLKLPLFLSHSIGFVTATSIGYVLHSSYTFNVKLKSIRNLLFFLMQVLISFTLGFFILKKLIILGVMPSVAKPIQLAITFAFNVIIGKKVSFK